MVGVVQLAVLLLAPEVPVQHARLLALLSGRDRAQPVGTEPESGQFRKPPLVPTVAEQAANGVLVALGHSLLQRRVHGWLAHARASRGGAHQQRVGR